MKIAVLGSSGTLGYEIYSNLSTNYNVASINRDVCNLTDLSQLNTLFKEGNFDVVINCATAGGGKSIGTFNGEHIDNNLRIFKNLKELSNLYGVLINIGSGAEYDITKNIQNVKEEDILKLFPYDSYGLSKNIISRECLDMDNAITLRIFGCFSTDEPSYRLLRNFVDYNHFGTILSSFTLDDFELKNDRKFSWISSIDFVDIIDQVIHHRYDIPKDINCAYPNPIKLSETLDTWCKLHNKNYQYKIVNNSEFEYTCNTDLMESFFNIKYGFENSLRLYK